MTMMTMTHSDQVSTGCQPCPADANGEVVTSIKKESVDLMKIPHTSCERRHQYLQADRWSLAPMKIGEGNS